MDYIDFIRSHAQNDSGSSLLPPDIISGPRRNMDGDMLAVYNDLVHKHIDDMGRVVDKLQLSGHDYMEDAIDVFAAFNLFVKNYRYRPIADAKAYILQQEVRVLKAGQILYHGSEREFTKDTFFRRHLNQAITFFTTDKSYAHRYGENVYAFRVMQDVPLYHMTWIDRIAFYGIDFEFLPRFEDWIGGEMFPDIAKYTLEQWAKETYMLPNYEEMRGGIGRVAEYGAHDLIRRANVNGIWSEDEDDGPDEFALTPQALARLHGLFDDK